MCNCHNNTCAECGAPAVSVQERGYTCDNCGRYICDSCWNKLPLLHIKQPSKSGLTGFLKYCKKCRTRSDASPVTPNPFIG